MSQWTSARLGDLLRPCKLPAVPLPDASYREITVKLWGKGVVQRGTISGSAVGGKRFIARAGQFIVSRIDARNGALGIVPLELDGALVSNDFPLFEIAKDSLDDQFLGWLVRTRQFVELCRRASEGSTNRVRLRESKFLNLVVNIPRVDEQRRIARAITSSYLATEEAARLRTSANEQREALYRKLTLNIFDTLEGPSRTLGEVVTMRGGGTPSKHDPTFWTGPVPWITPKDMKVRELHDALDHISESATLNSPAKLLPVGAVLIVVRGMILVHTVPVALLRAPAAINQDMKALIPTPEILPEFLTEYLWAKNADLLALIDRSTHDTRKLLTDKLLGLPVVVPTIVQQQEALRKSKQIATTLSEAAELQTMAGAEIAAFLPSLLERVFTRVQ